MLSHGHTCKSCWNMQSPKSEDGQLILLAFVSSNFFLYSSAAWEM